jgi:hypothetical protein
LSEEEEEDAADADEAATAGDDDDVVGFDGFFGLRPYSRRSDSRF